MKDYVAHIVPVQNGNYVLLVITRLSSIQYEIYFNSTPQVRSEIEKELELLRNLSISLSNTNPTDICNIAERIALIKQGFDQDMSQIPLDYSDYTEKQTLVIKAAITIPVNDIWPYSKVAEVAGLPKAQRFVGTTMKTLRQPYIVPVHRVKSLGYIRKIKSPHKRNFDKMPL